MMTANSIYVGSEVEGPAIGQQTIFIPKGAMEQIAAYKVVNYMEENGINRIRFGAGKHYGLCDADIALIQTLPQDYEIQAEISAADFTLIHNRSWEELVCVDFILVITHPHATFVEHVKTVSDDHVMWMEIADKYFTNKTDKRYKKIKELIL